MRVRWVTTAVLVAGLVVPAWAQTPPAGNEHPATPLVSPAASMLLNPFNPAGERASLSEEQRRRLAAEVDLEPLRSLAVFHRGRVKILDTLARETIAAVTGRRAYEEVILTASGRAERVRYDPLFTFLDLVIDPWAYADKPVVGVEYLPLRRAIVEAVLPDDVATQERWLRLGRVSPRMIASQWSHLHEKYAFQESYRRALDRVGDALSLVDEGWRNLLLVAPPSPDAPYAHLATLEEGSVARTAARELGQAWRAGDAAGVNAAAKILADALPRIHPQVYPTHRRMLELAYNRANAFEWGMWAYLVALVGLILAFGTGRRWLIGVGVGTLAVAVTLHALGFVARCVIAERLAIQNQFESMTGVSLLANLVGLGLMVARRQWLYGAAAAGVGFLVLITATQTGIPGRTIEREAAILNTSVLLKYHVTTVLSAYGLISLGFIISLFYLGTYYAARWRGRAGEVAAVALNAEGPAGTARTLLDLDRAQMTVLQMAFWTLGVGLLLGAWWADHSWGRWWAFDPKETWALVTWIVYLIVIHVRFIGGAHRGLVTAWLSIVGFGVMLWTYFGVNLLLPGLHAYA